MNPSQITQSKEAVLRMGNAPATHTPPKPLTYHEENGMGILRDANGVPVMWGWVETMREMRDQKESP